MVAPRRAGPTAVVDATLTTDEADVVVASETGASEMVDDELSARLGARCATSEKKWRVENSENGSLGVDADADSEASEADEESDAADDDALSRLAEATEARVGVDRGGGGGGGGGGG